MKCFFEEVVVGSLLGDAHLEKAKSGNCRLRFVQDITQLEYLNFKHYLLKPFSLKISTIDRFDKRTKRSYKQCKFDTKTTQQLNKFHSLFYTENLKKIDSNLQDIFKSKLTLLIWYLDDGTLRTDCHAFRFSTLCFTEDEISTLIKILKENFGLESKAHKEQNRYTIYIGSKNDMSKKFNDMFKPFVSRRIPSMLYKFY